MKRTLLETVLLMAVGTTVAFAGNALRTNKSIDWSRDYFKKSQVVVPTKPGEPDVNSIGTLPAASVIANTTNPVPNITPSVAAPSAKPEAEAHLVHDYQSINLDGVEAALADPRYEQGLIVFVDARADEPFEAGHIPGALQCDHYQLDKYINAVMNKARVAEQVIVYCNGGQCEDSIFMCQNLMERGLDYKAIYLYEGGWKEWEQSGNPIAKGKETP